MLKHRKSDKLEVIFLPPRFWNIDLDQQVSSESERKDYRNNTFLHLKNEDVEVKIINPSFATNKKIRSFNPYILGLDPFRAIKILLFHRNASCVVSISESGGFFLLLLRKLFLFKPKIILWDLSAGNKWKLVQILQKFTLPRYDGVMLLNSSQGDYLKRLNYLGKKKLISYNVDENFFNPNVNNEEGYILSVGDDISRDYETLFNALSEIKFKTIVKSSLKLPQTNNKNIHILKERLTDDEYRNLIANATLVVIPLLNIEHAGGITFLFESMAMGKPIIITESSISNDYLNEESASIVPIGNEKILNQEIKKLLEDSELRSKYSKNVRKIIEDKFTTKHLARKIKDFCLEFKSY